MLFRKGSPVYLQIAARISEQILAGKLNAGERLPGQAEQGRLFRVNKIPCMQPINIWSAYASSSAAKEAHTRYPVRPVPRSATSCERRSLTNSFRSYLKICSCLG